MRILLTSVGRRGYLVRFFREGLGPGDEVWGGDCSPLAPAFEYCHRTALLPRVTEPSYVDDLLDLCRRCKIDAVVPLFDPELEVLAHQRDRFFNENIMAVVSPARTIDIGFDKVLTFQFGREAGLPVPETVVTVEEAERKLADGSLDWPLVVKPRKGMASTDIRFCHSMEDLRAAFGRTDLPMIQEFLGGDEYGYDIFGDQQFRPVSVFCKKKLAMRAGETDKAVSVDDPELIGLGRRLAENLQIFGPLDADVKLAADGQPKLLEINPRFGGGYPCAHLCGADFPAKLLRMCRGETIEPDIGTCRAGTYMFKQDEIIRRTAEQVDAVPSHRDVGPDAR